MSKLARRMWSVYERIHSVIYFSDEGVQAAADTGYRGFWMGYFALRAAPLGPVGPDVVAASFYGFHRSRVERAIPDAWRFAPPDLALAARLNGVDAALRRLWRPLIDGFLVREAADLLWAAAQAADVDGRMLAGANQRLACPPDPHLRLWQATTTLREHRGDGHNAVLVSSGVGPVEAHLLKIAAQESEPETLRLGRNWPEADWVAARDSLRDRNWIDSDDRLTSEGADARAAIEQRTDEIAAKPWRELGDAGVARLLNLLTPLVDRITAAAVVPSPNPVGVPDPDLFAVPHTDQVTLGADG